MPARRHRKELDAGLHERIAAGKQRFDGGQRRGTRAEIAVQRVALVGAVARGEVGVDVAAAKAIDRLLGIADQEQRAFPIVRRDEQALEDRPLARVGVLEFVHQRDAVLAAQAFGECIAGRARQRLGDAADHVVVTDQAAFALERVEPLASEVARFVHERDPTLFFGQHPLLDGVEQRRHRRLATGFRFLL